MTQRPIPRPTEPEPVPTHGDLTLGDLPLPAVRSTGRSDAAPQRSQRVRPA